MTDQHVCARETETGSLVILSGGLDSTVLAYATARERPVDLLTFDYGQRHRREIHSARATAERLGARHDVVDLRGVGALISRRSALTGAEPVPNGHYAEESMKVTVVPNRNMIMLAIAAGVALDREIRTVAFAVHAGDHAIYPDCRPVFVEALDRALGLADWSPVRLLRPFVNLSKAAIVALGQGLRVPFGGTWSCYRGGEDQRAHAREDETGSGPVHCGECGTCVERREAFWIADVPDPTRYAVGEEVTRAHLARGKPA